MVKESLNTAPEQSEPSHLEEIYAYPWEQDSTFQSGYLSILEQSIPLSAPEPCDDAIDLLLKAQCFFFARKSNLLSPPDVEAYKAWIEARSVANSHFDPVPLERFKRLHLALYRRLLSQRASAPSLLHSIESSSFNSSAPSFAPAANLSPSRNGKCSESVSTISGHSSPPEPPYPTSFAAIIDLITRNEAIPGIEEIPNTVLDAELSPPNKIPLRQKPWEKVKDNTSEFGVRRSIDKETDQGRGLGQRGREQP